MRSLQAVAASSAQPTTVWCLHSIVLVWSNEGGFWWMIFPPTPK